MIKVGGDKMKYNRNQELDYKIEKLTKDNRDFVLEHIFGEADLKFIDDFIEDKNAIGYFVYSNEDVLGYIHGYVLTRLQNRPMLYIHNMSVKKKYRHLGIGTLMMETMKHHAKEHNLSKIFLMTSKSNKRAVELFKKENGKVPHKDDVVFVWDEVDL